MADGTQIYGLTTVDTTFTTSSTTAGTMTIGSGIPFTWTFAGGGVSPTISFSDKLITFTPDSTGVTFTIEKYKVQQAGAVEGRGFYGYRFTGANSLSYIDFYRGGDNLGINFYWATEYSTISKTVYLFNNKDATHGRLTANSDVQTFFGIDPRINQSGTAGYTGLRVNATEDATGSGRKLLADLQLGGVSRFNIDNSGNMMAGAGSLNMASLASSSYALYIDEVTGQLKGTVRYSNGTTGLCTLCSITT
jgi:hypothetical protein